MIGTAIILCVCNLGCVQLTELPRDLDQLDDFPEFADESGMETAIPDSFPIVLAMHLDTMTPDDTLEIQPGLTRSASQNYSIAEIIAEARMNHARVIASGRRVEQARADVGVAGNKQNPEFVIDVETPIHDNNDATKLSTRVTFPLGQSRLRRSRIRVARSKVATAMAAHQAEIHRQSQVALLAALQLAYLQEKVALDELADQLSRQRLQLLSPESRDGDSADNLVDYINAANDAHQARRERFNSRRDLAVAQVAVADAMGVNLGDETRTDVSIVVSDPLQSTSLDLPPLHDVIAAALIDSAELATALSATQQAWLEQQLYRNQPLATEVGPLYQDRLGRDDNKIGFRIQTDLPLHDAKRNSVIAAGIRAQVTEDSLKLTRQQIANATARDYQELKSIAEQLRLDRADSLIADQEKILADIETQNVMTGEQTIRIRQSILDRQRDQLNLEYQFAMLRSKLRLHGIKSSIY